MSTPIWDASDPAAWGPAIDEAVATSGRGGLLVLPTDTVYGIGADAFDPDAVAALLAAKGRGRQSPPPVLIPDIRTIDGLASDIPDDVRKLVEAFWPGGLTIICHAQPSLMWDLGETHGTVALRMPDHPTALALLRRTGPMAVSSANLTGQPPAMTAQEAHEQLGTSVQVFLDAGRVPGGVASTIIDATSVELRIVREGAISREDIERVVPLAAEELGEPEEPQSPEPTQQPHGPAE